jgi:hypothetical protein
LPGESFLATPSTALTHLMLGEPVSKGPFKYSPTDEDEQTHDRHWDGWLTEHWA